MRATSTILLVEDDAAMREMLLAALSEHPIRAVEATTPEEAMRAFSEHEFDLVLSEIHCWVGDGSDALDSAHPSAIPVVLMTRLGSPVALEQVRHRGAVAVLEKPFEVRQLLDLLAVQLHW